MRRQPYTRRDASATWGAATTIRLTTIHLDPLVRYEVFDPQWAIDKGVGGGGRGAGLR